MADDSVDVVVIGAGVVGLAIPAELSRRLSKSKATLFLLERHERHRRLTRPRRGYR